MTTYKRVDVVLVRFPHSDLETFKKRPALVVQAEDLDTDLPQQIIAMITTNLKRKGSTRVLVRAQSSDGKGMGLLHDSVIAADNLATVREDEVDKVIGKCRIMPQVEEAFRVVLGL